MNSELKVVKLDDDSLTEEITKDQSIELILCQLIELNIKVFVKDGNLHLNIPIGALSDKLKRLIKDNKQALLSKISDIDDSTVNLQFPRIVSDKDNLFAPFPLSDVQHAYWVGRNKGIEFGNVATHYYYELHCHDLDLLRFTKALNLLITRHDMMRAIVTEDGHQRILNSVPNYDIETIDLRYVNESEKHRKMLLLRDEMSAQVHSTHRWPLYDIRAILLNDQETQLYFSWDFLNLDAWSLYTISREWVLLYENLCADLPSINISYRDYILAERGLRDTPFYQRDRDYWWNRIDTIPEAPQLPIKSEYSNDRHKFTRRRFRLNKSAWQLLKEKGANIGITPSNILLTAYAEVLALWSQYQHFTLNLTFFNRQPMHEDVNNLVGDFTSLTLLEADLRKAQPFYKRALQLQKQFMRDFEHRSVCGVDVLREWSKRRGLSLQATMPVVFTSCLVLRRLINFLQFWRFICQCWLFHFNEFIDFYSL